MDSAKFVYKKNELFTHLIIWIVLLLYTSFDFSSNRTNLIRFVEPSLFIKTYIIINAAVVYFHYLLVMPRIVNAFSWFRLILGISLSISLFIVLRAFIEQFLTLYLFDIMNYYSETSVKYYIFDNIIYALVPILISSVIWIVFYTIRILYRNNILLEESKKAEIKFLKAQINPHFIFNTLNNIYSMVYMKNEKSLEAIEKLSGIMRFTTYESERDFITLEEEINYINNYLDLERLRYDNGIFIEYDMDVSNYQIKIPPFTISPLLENAFKHGIVNDKNNPVHFKVIQKNQELYIVVKNKINDYHKDQSKGVGLTNLKNRLEFYYESIGNFELNIMNVEEFYEVSIKLLVYEN